MYPKLLESVTIQGYASIEKEDWCMLHQVREVLLRSLSVVETNASLSFYTLFCCCALEIQGDSSFSLLSCILVFSHFLDMPEGLQWPENSSPGLSLSICICMSVSPCISFTLSLFLSFSCFLIDMPEGLQFSFSCSLFSVSLSLLFLSLSLFMMLMVSMVQVLWVSCSLTTTIRRPTALPSPLRLTLR